MIKFQHSRPFIRPTLDKWFIPVHLRDKGLTHWKARLLAVIHLFLFSVTLAMELFAFFLDHSTGIPPLRIALISIVPLAYVFRRWGNFLLSGNLLCLVIALLLYHTVMSTGGLFSDNLLWMLIVPLLALLFANRLSGFLWLLALSAFTVYLFTLENEAPGKFVEQIANLGSLYYLISFIGLFVMVVGIVLVFATGQEMIVRALDENRAELTQQKEELVRQAESLRKAEELLLKSNQELEQFAYAASHDLKEPLRMIGMYTQLIQKRLHDHLDESSTEYMYFVTDGVTRMERLLHDLLEYSRLGKTADHSTKTDLNEILMVVVHNLMARMQETDAEIMANELPVLHASSTEMTQLFQNLIANSIKFRKNEGVPLIRIDHQVEGNVHSFSFTDNGIGIAEEYKEKVFNIFERVHSKADYEGTGIGLATCKKIVNNMGGKIWIESEQNVGTTFHFTFPTEETA